MNYLDFFSKKRVMIAGGNGFFGSKIVKILKRTDCQIFIPQTKKGIDFRRSEDCRAYISLVAPDIVINSAAHQGGIGYHSGKQADLFMDNIQMGINLMKASSDAGVKKFVNIVAGCSYPGYIESGVMNESEYWDGEVHESIFSYGFSRKASVVYGKALNKQYGFNSIHLVLANMYGPGEHFNPEQSKALAGLIKKIYEAKLKKQKNIEIWGTGKPIRDWLYVEDGAEGVLRASAVYNSIEPLNISTGIGVSISELANVIKNIAVYKGGFIYNTKKPDGAMHKIFGAEKMKKELKWAPTTSIKSGVRKTYYWFSKNYIQAIKY